MLQEEIEKLLARLKQQRKEAEAEAANAARNLTRLGMEPVSEVDRDAVYASAKTFDDAIQCLKMLDEFMRALRNILM